MTRLALTKANWQRIYAAANKPGGDLKEAVETVVRRRLVDAWDQGYAAGWTAGVDDATEDDPPQPQRNPYRVEAKS